MAELTELFRPICAEVQAKLQGALKGFVGSFVRGYLPQAWVFRTEKEFVTFSVGRDGNASVAEGDTSAPDVVITVDHAYLCEALRTRKKPEAECATFEVKFCTGKGETAFQYVRGQIGL